VDAWAAQHVLAAMEWASGACSSHTLRLSAPGAGLPAVVPLFTPREPNEAERRKRARAQQSAGNEAQGPTAARKLAAPKPAASSRAPALAAASSAGTKSGTERP
jgi:hypothetical protein